MQKPEEKYMQRCFELAQIALGDTYPNPIVGCVIVHEGKIIGEGYHQKCGEAHAEVHALHAVKNKALLKASDVYVSLEPCAHTGRTPACSDALIASKVKRIIIGCKDPFEKVNGKGIERMQNSGIQVVTSFLEEEARQLNRRFFTFHEKKRPYIILKWARTSDGFIDFERKPGAPVYPNWITDEYARMLVHKWRSEEAAIMVATDTARKDNPKLNVRDWKGNNPLRIVLDRRLGLSSDLHLFDGSVKTLVVTEETPNKKLPGVEFLQVPFEGEFFYEALFKALYEKGIQSVFVEGGAKFLQNLIDRNYWDEAREFIGTPLFLSGVKAPIMRQLPVKETEISGNKLLYYTNT